MTLDGKVPSGPLETKWDEHKGHLKLVNPNNKRKFTILVVDSGLAGASAAASGKAVGQGNVEEERRSQNAGLVIGREPPQRKSRRGQVNEGSGHHAAQAMLLAVDGNRNGYYRPTHDAGSNLPAGWHARH